MFSAAVPVSPSGKVPDTKIYSTLNSASGSICLNDTSMSRRLPCVCPVVEAIISDRPYEIGHTDPQPKLCAFAKDQKGIASANPSG